MEFVTSLDMKNSLKRSQGHLQRTFSRNNALEWRRPIKNWWPLWYGGVREGSGQAHTSEQPFLLRSVTWDWQNEFKPRDASVPDVLYTFFGNHYLLVEQVSNNLEWMKGYQPCFHASTNDTWRWYKGFTQQFTVTLKMRKVKDCDGSKQWNRFSPCLRKNPLWYLECTVLYKLCRSLALNIGLFKKKIKMSFGTYIHSLQSSVFATRKKGVAEARNWFIVLVKA